MKVFMIFSIFLTPIILSCTITKASKYIVLTDVPDNPSMTILPASNTAEEIYFSNEVEAYIINLGVKTISQPVYKEVVTKKQLEERLLDKSYLSFPGMERWGKYFMLDNTPADYIVFTYNQTRQVRIIKKENKQVICSFVLKPASTDHPELVMEKVLRSAGILARSNK